MKKLKVLFFDIETTPIKSWIWHLGKQWVNHKQLCKGSAVTKIICIGYAWNDGKPAKAVEWDYDSQSSRGLIRQFDAIASKADIIIGKNSDRFDIKHINTLRMFYNLDGVVPWSYKAEDLEKQMRKHFKLQSNSLDYISNALGHGGKDKMEFQDWVDICEQNKNGRSSQRKMVSYCKKDVEDTRAVWDYCEKYFTPKWNMSRITDSVDMVCITCGSDAITRNGTRMSGGSLYQQYHCNKHGGYAGKVLIKPENPETVLRR